MNYREQVAHLQEQGYSVRIQHLRIWKPVSMTGLVVVADARTEVGPATVTLDIAAKGGRTVASIYHADDKLVPVAIGYAYCNDSDVYNRRHGRTVALGRAVQGLVNLRAAERVAETQQRLAASLGVAQRSGRAGS